MFQLKVNQWCFYEYSFHWPTCKTTLRGTEVKKGYGLQRLCTMNQSETSSAVGASMYGKCLRLKKRKEIKYASFLAYFLSKIQVNCFAVILLFKISKQTLDDMCYKKNAIFLIYTMLIQQNNWDISEGGFCLSSRVGKTPDYSNSCQTTSLLIYKFIGNHDFIALLYWTLMSSCDVAPFVLNCLALSCGLFRDTWSSPPLCA